MSKEKANYRDVVQDLCERSGGKMVFNCRAIMRVLGIGHNKAAAYLDGEKEITVYELARKLIK